MLKPPLEFFSKAADLCQGPHYVLQVFREQDWSKKKKKVNHKQVGLDFLVFCSFLKVWNMTLQETNKSIKFPSLQKNCWCLPASLVALIIYKSISEWKYMRQSMRGIWESLPQCGCNKKRSLQLLVLCTSA